MKRATIKIFQNIPTLRTERFILRRIVRDDIDDIYDYSSNPETSRYLLWYPHDDLSVTRAYFKIINRKYKNGTFYDWGIVDAVSGKMIGTCGFTAINELDNRAEIGYVINPSYKGRGIATEVVRRVIRFGFEVLGLERIEARYIIGNDASRRVMEKCGMSFEGIHKHAVRAKGRYFDVGVCAVIAGEHV